MSVLKLLVVKLSKIGFHILSTHFWGCIYHKQSAVTFPITQWNSLLQCMRNVCFPFVAWKYSSSNLPVSYKIHTSLHERFPKFMPMKTQVLLALGVSVFALLSGHLQEGLVAPSRQHPTLQIQNYNSHTCTYPDFFMGGSCQCEKKLWLHTSNGPNGLLGSGWALKYYVNWVHSAFKCSALMPTNWDYTAYFLLKCLSP